MNNLMSYWLILISLISGIFGSVFVIWKGGNIGLLDIPSDRSSHNSPIPKGGGVGILCCFSVCGLLLDISWAFWLSVVAISMASFVGDRIDLSPKLRLMFQFLITGIVLFHLDPQKQFILNGLTSKFHFDYLFGFIFLSLFIVGTTNFYNFMDGINGIATITGIIAFGFIAFVCYQNDHETIYLLSICLSVACAGFLPFNFPKAKVFLGDVGSILLGFIFSCLVTLVSKNMTDFLCYTGFILPFYFDEIGTMFERIRNKEPLTKAHRRHLYQVLANEAKIAHWKVSTGYGIVQLIVSLLILLILRHQSLLVIITFYGVSFVLFFLISNQVKKRIRGL